MLNRAVWVLACVLLGAMLVFSAGCSSDSGDEAETAPAATETTEDTESEPEETEGDEASDEGSTGMAAFVGTWENAEGSVFHTITFREDGTADTVTYAGVEAPATWTLDGTYLEVETDAEESWGSDTMWISDTEWDWAYEDGTWTAVE